MQEERSDDLLLEVKGGNFQHRGCGYLTWMELTGAANYCFHSLLAPRTELPGNPRNAGESVDEAASCFDE